MNTTWPSLDLDNWEATKETLHMWTQIVGKIRLDLAPHINHWWQVPLYLTPRGMTTSPMPDVHGARGRMVQIDFDFLSHELLFQTSEDECEAFALESMSVADFYAKVVGILDALKLEVTIWPVPVEVQEPVPFAENDHGEYDSEYAQRLWRALLQSDRVMTEFRSWFLGKVSPVHFFWGSFDLAVTRFSGRDAPTHPGVPIMPDFITHEAYSHEVSSAGFFPGGGGANPIFYAYAYPTPDGFAEYSVQPDAAFFHNDLGEFVLPYEAVRTADDPDQMLLDFLQSTYEAAAELADWDRGALER